MQAGRSLVATSSPLGRSSSRPMPASAPSASPRRSPYRPSATSPARRQVRARTASRSGPVCELPLPLRGGLCLRWSRREVRRRRERQRVQHLRDVRVGVLTERAPSRHGAPAMKNIRWEVDHLLRCRREEWSVSTTPRSESTGRVTRVHHPAGVTTSAIRESVVTAWAKCTSARLDEVPVLAPYGTLSRGRNRCERRRLVCSASRCSQEGGRQ